MATENGPELRGNQQNCTHVDTAAEYNKIASAYSAAEDEDIWLHTTFYTFTNYVLGGEPDTLKDAAVLELGCGSGVFCRWAAAQGAARVVGVDISEQQIFRAHESRSKGKNGTIKYIVEDAANMNGTTLGQFDIVLAAHILCYAQSKEDLRRMLGAASSCLKRGGRLVGVTECLDSASWGRAPSMVKGDLEGGPMFSYQLVGVANREDQQCKDFSHCKLAFRNSDNSFFTFTTFPAHESTLAEMFIKAGFQINSLGPRLACSPEGRKLFPSDFIETLINDFGKIYSYFDVTKL